MSEPTVTEGIAQAPLWRRTLGWFYKHPLKPEWIGDQNFPFITPLLNLAIWIFVPGSLLFFFIRRRK